MEGDSTDFSRCPSGLWMNLRTTAVLLRRLWSVLKRTGYPLAALAAVPSLVGCSVLFADSRSLTEVIVVSGQIVENPIGSENPISVRIELDPIFVLPGQYPTEPQEGADYAVVSLDAAGTELARQPFNPVRNGHPVGFPYRFEQRVPFRSGTAQVRIEYRSRVIADIHPGPSAPSVRIIAPNGGEVLSGSDYRVNWEASDGDGDELAFLVGYSDDEGRTWSTLAGPVQADHVDVPAINMEFTWGGSGRFRVWASDGIHTSYDESDGSVQITGSEVLAEITDPHGPTMIVSGEPLVLNGLSMTATDQHDGFEIRDDRRFIWTSDLEGLLSAEQFAVVELKTVGTHTITLTVTDDKGRTATDQLEVEVVAGATLQAGPTSLGLYSGGPQAERVWVESFPPEESLPWRAVAGDPWLRLGQTSGRTPAEIDVSYDSQLAAGQYWTILTLTSPEAPERSLTIEVWITIE